MKIKVLCLDDDKTRLQKIEAMISSLDFLVKIHLDCCSCIVKCKRFLESEQYDFFIMDVIVPEREGDRPSSVTGLQFLKEVQTRSIYNKPQVIIGITADHEGVLAFRKEFTAYLQTLIETPFNSQEWLDSIKTSIQYRVESILVALNKSAVIAVHGLSSYGLWHNKLSNLLKAKEISLKFKPYQYGVYSPLFFLIPFIRNKEIRRFKTKFSAFVAENKVRPVRIVAHSFGTYIVARALTELVEENFDFEVELLLLCGSVLKSSYPITNLSANVKHIVNDCGCDDIPLCFSQLFAYDAGMSGRVGFKEMASDNFVNRFFCGGHGLYFSAHKNSTCHMTEFWLPLLVDCRDMKACDFREEKFLRNVIDIILTTAGPFKIFYTSILCLVGVYLFCSYLIKSYFG